MSFIDVIEFAVLVACGCVLKDIAMTFLKRVYVTIGIVYIEMEARLKRRIRAWALLEDSKNEEWLY